ncbi:sulfite exporter TauE/SafE family protein [soil metagenome]
MTALDALLLALAGVGAGLTGSIAGLASLASYPALLAFGLPPYAANVTNSVALLANGAGSAIGSRRELRGQGRRVAWLSLQSAIGGCVGAALLLLTDPEAFEVVVPWLVALGALLLIGRNRLRDAAERRRISRGAPAVVRSWRWPLLIALAGIYGGYFGAGAGIILLAVLSVRTIEPLAVTNAVKNVATSTANGVAAVAYMIFAPVDWPAALVLGAGALVGAWTGPSIVRFLPETPLRWAIGAAGLGLAGYLLLA